MRTTPLATAIVLLAATALLAQPEPRPTPVTSIYVGTYTNGQSKGIYRIDLDTKGGTLSEPTLAADAVNPSFLAWHPTKPILYAVGETDTVGPEKSGSVVAFAVERDGRLTKINEEPSGGGAPCYVSVHQSGTHVLVANYGGGSVAALPIQPSGALSPASSVVQHRGSSADPKRQRGPHAHSILPVPGSPFVLSADLGIDRVLVYRFDPKDGSLTANEPPAVAATPGAGPRHLALHPGGDAVFVINELQSTIASYKWDAVRGTLTPIAGARSTLPADFAGENTTAEVAVHPSGRFVYGSNRGHDSIAAFRVEADRTLTRIGHYTTGGRTPRHFAIDPTGTFLLAANQRSDTLVLFRIDPQTGALTDTAVRARVPSPVCVRFRVP